MPDVVYTVGLNDMFSSKLKVIESNIDRLEKKLSTIGKMGGSGGSMRTESIASGVAFGTAAYNLIAKGAYLIKDLGSDVMRKGLEMAKLRTDINILAGAGGAALFSQLQNYASNSMYGMGVFKSAKQMLAYGFSSGEIPAMLKSMGNIAGADESKLGRLIYAASEIQAGDVSKMHIRQLMMAGLPMQDLAKAMHTNTKQLTEDIKHHKITSAALIEGIRLVGETGRFADRMSKLMDTPAGRVTQLKTNWDLFKANVGEGILATQGFKDFLTEMNKAFSLTGTFRDKFVQFGSDIFEALTRIVKKLEIFVDNGGLDKIIHVLTFIINNFENIATTLITIKLSSSLISLTKALGAIGEGGVIGGMTALGEVLLPLVAVVGMLYGAFKVYDEYISAVVNWIKGNGFTSNAEMQNQKDLATQNEKLKLLSEKESLSEILDKNMKGIKGFNGTPSQGIYGDVVGLGYWEKRLNQIGEYVTRLEPTATQDKVDQALSTHKELLGDLSLGVGEKYIAAIQKLAELLGKNTKALTGKDASNLTTEESKVVGSRPINININIQDMIRNMFQDAVINSDDPGRAMNNVRDAVLQTMAEAINVAQSYADSNQP